MLSSKDGMSLTEYEVNGNAWDKDAIYATGKVYRGNIHEYSYAYELGKQLNFGAIGNAAEYLISGFSNGSVGTHTDKC